MDSYQHQHGSLYESTMVYYDRKKFADPLPVNHLPASLVLLLVSVPSHTHESPSRQKGMSTRIRWTGRRLRIRLFFNRGWSSGEEVRTRLRRRRRLESPERSLPVVTRFGRWGRPEWKWTSTGPRGSSVIVKKGIVNRLGPPTSTRGPVYTSAMKGIRLNFPIKPFTNPTYRPNSIIVQVRS